MLAVNERISYLYQREGLSIDTLSTERKANNLPADQDFAPGAVRCCVKKSECSQHVAIENKRLAA
ncbi:MAG: hypothetical protein ACI87E_002375 [Mariniblastus sp.]|jgi:hypothetical protein